MVTLSSKKFQQIKRIVSSGGITGTVAGQRLICAAALKGKAKANACAMIILHKHPSRNLKPSRHDEDLIAKIKQAGTFFDIKIVDHLILTTETYYSFADQGIL